MSDHNEPTGHACPSCGQIYARENIIEANAAEIEECNRIISAVCKENGRLLSANVALQAVVDRILEYIDSGGCYLVTVKRIIKQDLALNSGEQE